MMKAIVTGASGFVGRAVCSELASRGYEVTAVVRDAAKADVEAAHIIECDMRDYGRLTEKIGDCGFDVMYHFAWQGTAGDARRNYEIQLDNVRASCVLAEQCAALKCRRFVYAASIMEYEVASLMETPGAPAASNIYSSAKLAADYMTRTVAVANGTEYIRAVISNIYGVGENSPRLINTSIRKLLNGEHCSFSAGEQMYDFVYIDDAARLFAAIGDKGKNNMTYYIGSQDPKPLKTYLLAMRDAIAPGKEIGLGKIPFDGVSLTYREFDVDSVYKDTGIRPTVSFEDGIRNTYRWICQEEHLDGYTQFQ